MNEIFISIDAETTGPVPEKYSMYELGACVVGDDKRDFISRIALLNDNFEQAALAACGRTVTELKARFMQEEPGAAMRRFADWVKRVAGERRPVFTAFNATFDWMFVHWYFHSFLDASPFGIGGLDIKAYYMGLMKCAWEDTKKSSLDPRFSSPKPHTHNALDDAIRQAEIFAKMLSYDPGKK